MHCDLSRNPEGGDLLNGLAYCGTPEHRLTNDGKRVDAPVGMGFIVFVSETGAIFDWYWAQVSSDGIPIDSEQRFAEKVWPPRD